MTIEHRVLTRFDVRLPGYSQRPNTEWYRKRVALFGQYTASTLGPQISDEEQWLVFVDEEIPDIWLKKCLDEAIFKPVRVSGFFTADVAAHAVIESIKRSTLQVATTRLDNDDAVCSHFLEHIHDGLTQIPPDRQYLNLITGCQWDGQFLYNRPWTSNSFMTRQEPRHNLRTVFETQHDHVPSGQIFNLPTTHPAWAQVVHSNNLANEVVGLPSRDPITIASNFTTTFQNVSRPTRLTLLLTAIRILFRLGRKPRRILELAKYAASRVRAPHR